MCIITYRGIKGKYSLNDEERKLSGKIIDIPETIYFEGGSILEVESDFRSKAEKYVQIKYQENRKGNKYLDGHISVNIDPKLHCSFDVHARSRGKLPVELIKEFIESTVYAH